MRNNAVDDLFDDVTNTLSSVKKKQYTTIILDESGSMAPHKKSSIEEFNNQLSLAKEQTDLDIYMSLVTFNNTVKPIYWMKPVSELSELDPSSYRPNNGTALLDAIGYTVSRLDNEAEQDATHLVFVISDGEECSSLEWSAEKIKKMLMAHTETTGWTITYFGCNVDTFTLQNMGFNLMNTQVFKGVAGPQGMYGSSNSTLRSHSTRTYYNNVTTGSWPAWFYDNTTSTGGENIDTQA